MQEPVSTLSVRLFGPFDVQVQGKPLPHLRTRKGQWLLALLILRADRQVSRSWLAGTLWPQSLQEEAVRNLRQSLHDLRRALGEEAWRLQATTPQTLGLELEGAWADVVAFEAAIAAGSASSLEQAVSLYGGVLLEGCEEEWVLLERQQREQAYLQAREQLAEYALQAGNPAGAVVHLRAVIGVDPLRESTQRRLMQALAANGDYAAVVEVYRELRLWLHRELNAEPDAQTTALFEQLRQQARAQARSRPRDLPAPAAPTASAPQPARSPDAVPTNLPLQLTSFIGREQEIAEVQTRLAKTRLLTLTGAGGCGKTRLALQVAAEVREEYPEGVWLVEFASLADPALVPERVLQTLNLREEPGRSLEQTLLDSLKTRKLLLLLDNCEHLVEACAHLADTLLRACPDLTILATSREVLQVAGEQPWRVPPMRHPTADQLPSIEKELAGVLLEYDACRLFVERAQVQRPEFILTRSNSLALIPLCQHLDGIPLALELAAARVRSLTVEQIASRLDDRFRLLSGGSRSALPRQQTLRALIDWSYDLLTEPERLLLGRLSVFVGGWTLEAAECICTSEDKDGEEREGATRRSRTRMKAEEERVHPSFFILYPSEVLDLLTSLVDKSLVNMAAQGEAGRYWLLETVRQYAGENLIRSGEAEVVRRWHRDYYLEWAERFGQWRSLPPGVERMAIEDNNLRAALDFCRETPDGAEAGLRLINSVCCYWYSFGLRQELWQRYAEALAHPGVTPTLTWWDARLFYVEVKALWDARLIKIEPGIPPSDDPVRILETALAAYRQAGDRSGEGYALYILGLIYMGRQQSEAACACFEQALEVLSTTDDQGRVPSSYFCLGQIALRREDYARALALFEECHARELKRGQTLGAGQLGLALAAFQLGDYARVYSVCCTALRAFVAANHLYIVGALMGLAQLAAGQRQWERAAHLMGAADGQHLTFCGTAMDLTSDAFWLLDGKPVWEIVESVLGPERYAAFFAAGRAMTRKQAVDYALE